MRTKLRVLGIGFGFSCLAVPIVAHHSFDAEYDRAKKVSLTGVVTKIEWTNPHMHVYVDVTDADGEVVNWNLELGSPNSVRRRGWQRKDLLPGEEVVFEAYEGRAVETRAAMARLAKVETPEKELFAQGGPEAANNLR